MVQTHVYPSYIQPLLLGVRQRTPAKPTSSSEPWYEGEEVLYESKARLQRAEGERCDTGWIQHYQAYWSVSSGSFGYINGHMNPWYMHPTQAYWKEPQGEIAHLPGVLMDSALDAPGSANVCHLKALTESRAMLVRVPDPARISLNTMGTDATLSPNLRCATRAEDGTWAFVYSTRGEVVRVVMSRLAGDQISAFWYTPRNGGWRYGNADHKTPQPFVTGVPSGKGAPDRCFSPPGEPADGNDWVLVLEHIVAQAYKPDEQ